MTEPNDFTVPSEPAPAPDSSVEPSFYERDGYRVLEYCILAAALVSVVLGSYNRSGADPAMSRLATVYALVEHGTFYIDRPLDEPPNPFEQRTIDKVEVNGRLISSKPPMLPLLMTADYLALNAAFGWELTNPEDLDRILYVITMTLAGGAYLLGLFFFRKILCLYDVAPLPRVVLLGSLAFGTQFWGMSTLFNNHVPGAGLLIAAIFFALALASGKRVPSWWRFALFGFTGAMMATIDLPGAIFVVLAGLVLLVKFPKATLAYVTAGAALPVLVHLGVMYGVTGELTPVQTRPETYLFESSFWRHPRGVDALNEPLETYLLHMTVGRKGIFLLFPVLLLGVFGLLRALYPRPLHGRGPILLGALGTLTIGAYYALTTDNYGGECYGFRWMIVAMPVLLLMAVPAINALRARWAWAAIAVMVGISFYSAWESSKTGWRANQEWTCRFLGQTYY